MFSIVAVQIVFAQPFYFQQDSLTTLTFTGSYFDILRTKNATSTSVVSIQKSSAQFKTTFGGNSLFILQENAKSIAQLDNSVSQIKFKTGQQSNRLTIDNEFSFSPFFAEQFVRINQIKSVSTVDYGGSFGFVTASHWLEKFKFGCYLFSFPWIFDLNYHDSRIDINNMTSFLKINYELYLRPAENTSLTLRYEKYLNRKNKNENPIFAVEDNSDASVVKINAVNSSMAIPIEISFTHGNGGSFFDLIYAQNSFSQNSFTNALFNGISVKSFEHKYNAWMPAFFVSYNFYKGFMVGNIQSWPFTSVLTSLITNRINYRLAGHLYFFTFETKKLFKVANFSVEPELSFYQILPEFTFDNWQPSYIVFGVKNFTRNILPIRKAIIGKLASTFIYQLNNYYSISLEFGQFVPLKITKKEIHVSEITPGTIVTQAQPSKVDGGRWLALSLRKTF